MYARYAGKVLTSRVSSQLTWPVMRVPDPLCVINVLRHSEVCRIYLDIAKHVNLKFAVIDVTCVLRNLKLSDISLNTRRRTLTPNASSALSVENFSNISAPFTNTGRKPGISN